MSDEKRAWLRQLGVTSLPAAAPARAPAMADAEEQGPGGFSFSVNVNASELLSIRPSRGGDVAVAPAPPPPAPTPPPLAMAPDDGKKGGKGGKGHKHDEAEAAEEAEDMLNVVATFGNQNNTPPPAPPRLDGNDPIAAEPPRPPTDEPAAEDAEEAEELLNILATFASQGTPADAPAPATNELQGGGTQEGLTIPGLPIPIPTPDPEIRCTITIDNQSEHVLNLIPGSIKLENPNGSGFDTKPPPVIAKGRTGTMVITNNFPFLTGVGGQLAYAIAGDDKKAQLFVKWERGRVPKRGHSEEIQPANPEKYSISGGFNGDDFTFTFVGLDSPGPNPGPGPATDVEANCQITVTNNTKVELHLTNQGHDFGDFMGIPQATVAPGTSTSFISTRTKGAKQQGCKGFVTYNVGDQGAVWRVDWSNPVGEKNTATAEINPASAGFDSLEQIGQGEENVPVVFTLSGGGAGPGPGPGPGPEPKPEPVFAPPPSSTQPTLRKGDESNDGWVEYLQQLLDLPVDGKFGPATAAAVIAYQKKNKLQADGVVGNQTWASLRHATPEAPSTDGRKPHSFEEKGVEARWFQQEPMCVFFPEVDIMSIHVESVGDETDISDRTATFKISPPNGKSGVVTVKIGKPFAKSPNGQGNTHQINIPNFTKDHPAKDPGTKGSDYEVEAYLEAELGGDFFKGKPTEMPGKPKNV